MKILNTVTLIFAISCTPLTALSIPIHPSGKNSPTTNDLIAICNEETGEVADSDDLMRAAYCLGFLKGLMGTIEYQSFVQVNFETHVPCLPLGFSPQQAIKMLEKYADENPERLHFEASMILSKVLEDAFPPCAPTND